MIPACNQLDKPTGFSLVELSVVLVIIGLIAGGIVAGRSMVRASELRSLMSDFGAYQAAVTSFQNKYAAIPGDMKTAVRYWGAAAGGTADGVDATCVALTGQSITTATCNGDGNGNINDATYEMYRFWQHLANAGFIDGQYSGTQMTATMWSVLTGTNVPGGKMDDSTWSVRRLGIYPGNATRDFAADYGNQFDLGGGSASSGHVALFTTADAYAIDAKLDDGKPAQGSVIAGFWIGCTTAADQNDTAAAAYDLAVTTPQCILYFTKAFGLQ